MLFAILLAFGGLARERQIGTSAFSLGLPVTRSRWFLTRMFVAAAESQLLALAAVIVVRFASWSIHEPYGAAQTIAHCLLIAVAGMYSLSSGQYRVNGPADQGISYAGNRWYSMK